MTIKPPRHYGPAGLPQEAVDQMWADFKRLGSLRAAGKLHGRTGGTLAAIFQSRGLRQRPAKNNPNIRKDRSGRFIAGRKTPKRAILAMVQQLTKAKIPDALLTEWRDWDMGRRMWLLKLIWQRVDLFDPENAQPAGPFSDNVQPFDYSTERAWEIVRQSCSGLSSRKWPVRMKVGSRGVIFENGLWWWCRKTGYVKGPFRKGFGRPALHRVLWERYNGRKLSAQETVIHLDGNKNNFAPENLGLRSRADCALQNSVQCRLKADPNNARLRSLNQHRIVKMIESRQRRSREQTALLLARFNHKDRNADLISKLAARR